MQPDATPEESPAGPFGQGELSGRSVEEALRESKESYRQMFHRNLAVKLLIDPATGDIIDANQAAADFYGHPLEVLRQMKITQINTLSRQEVEAEMQLAKEEKRIYFNFRHRLADGSVRDVEVYSGPVHAGGKTLLYSIIHDISTLKQAEERLRGQSELLAAINFAQTRFIEHADAQRLFHDLLAEALRITGSRYGFIAETFYGESGVPYLKALSITHDGNDPAVAPFIDAHFSPNMEFRNLDNLFGAVVTGGARVITNDPAAHPAYGGRLPAEHPPLTSFAGVPLYRGDRLIGEIGLANRPGGYDAALIDDLAPFITTCAQLIEAQHARNYAAQMERERDRFFELSQDILCLVGFDGYFKRVNRAFPRLLGHSAEKLLSRPFIDFVHPEDRVASLAEAARITEGVATVYFENRYICADGSYKWLAWSATPFLPEKIMYCVARDITERKGVEENLRRSNRELEQMAYVASHDLQEPLRMVASYVQLLAKRYKGKLDADADEFIGFAVEGAQRMQALIHDMLEYSRVTTRGKDLAPVAARDAAEAAIGNLAVAVEESGARISVGELPVVMADPLQLTQVFQNLIGNAIKFRGAAPPVIDVSAACTGAVCTVTVRDNGIGIDPRHFDRIFTMFQRLHSRREYAGTGIGLTICKRIVERHGGRIWVESEQGKGSAFHFTLRCERTAEGS